MEMSHPEQETPQQPVYSRMDGEPLLWFNRFKRYRSLGAKRTVQAALEQERAKIKALKSTPVEEKPAPSRVSPSRKQGLQPVPKPKTQVPGSWKQASIKWQWVERARAWDAHCIDIVVEGHLDDIVSDAAIGVERVRILKAVLKSLLENYKDNRTVMSFDQELGFIARIQSVLKDIREEMCDYDASVARLITRRYVQQLYEEKE
jgi:hypothetical protein